MKRTAAVCVLLAGLSGCVTPQGSDSAGMAGHQGVGYRRSVPGLQGPYGQPVPMMAGRAAPQPSGAQFAQAMMASGMMGPAMTTPGTAAPAMASGMMPPGMMPPGMMPPGMMPPGMMPPGGAPSGVMQASASEPAGAGSGIVQAGGMAPPGGPSGIMPVGCYPPVPNAVAAVGAITGPGGPRFPTRRSEVRFVGPAGMKISWPGAMGDVRNNQIEAPGRYNFIQGAIYRLKLSDLPGRPGVDLYPTLEVVPANLRTDAYIAHSAVPLYFTEEDFEQVLGGNFLVKVVYLPNPQYADVAMTGGPEEVVSTRLEPGADPIAEACKRGSILLIIRMGNIDLEAPHTPPMNAPPPGCGPMGAGPMPPGMPMAGMMPPGMPMGGMTPPGMPMAGMTMMPAPGLPGGMVMQPPIPPQIPGPPIMPVTPVAGDKSPAGPGVVPAKDAGTPQPGMGQPVSQLPEPSSVKPVRYQEPMNAPTPAQAAGQTK